MRLWLGFGLLLSAELSAVSAAVSTRGEEGGGARRGTHAGTGWGAPIPALCPRPNCAGPPLSGRRSGQVGSAGMPRCGAAPARRLTPILRGRGAGRAAPRVVSRPPHGVSAGVRASAPRDGPRRAAALPGLGKERRWLGRE